MLAKKDTSLMGNNDLGATVTDFMAILQSIDYNKFKDFLIKLIKFLQDFSQCEMLVVVPDPNGL